MISRRRQLAVGALLFQPHPLEETAFEQGGGSVVVEFKQFGRLPAVVTEVHAAIELRLLLLPTVGEVVPEGRWYRQLCQQGLAGQYLGHQRQRHFMHGLGGRFQLRFNLFPAELVVGTLVPIRLAVDRVKVKTHRFGVSAPIATLGNGFALHGEECAN